MRLIVTMLFLCTLCTCVRAAEKTENFDKDPGWDGHNNRIAQERQPITVHQDFGYDAAAHAIGGHISDAIEPAYYAKVIPEATFDTPLKASGTLAMADGAGQLLLGFFSPGALKEWRTANTIAIRLSGRGDHFYAYVEYGTSKWRAGGDNPKPFGPVDPVSGKRGLEHFASGKKVHKWSIVYDPSANNGAGVVTATIDDTTAICDVVAGHRSDGATFNRFGMLNLMKSAKGGGDITFDDVSINGQPADSFNADPQWEGHSNRKSWETRVVRPWFDFGYSPTNFAGGESNGELGGVIFRGDCRYPDRMACYGDPIGPITLEKPFKASGKIALTRGVSDSGGGIGFFNSKKSMEVSQRQDIGTPKCYLGLGVGGPSAEGFYVCPGYRNDGDGQGSTCGDVPLRILPDGKSHDWSLEYDPAAADGKGRITVTLDGKSVVLDLAEGHKSAGATFDRFGIVTSWIDGNSTSLYFDDLTYTVSQ